jgi:hypothetical protein
LGSQCKEKWTKAVIDKEDFNIRKGFESLEKSKSKPKQGQTKVDLAKRVVAVRRSGFQRIVYSIFFYPNRIHSPK